MFFPVFLIFLAGSKYIQAFTCPEEEPSFFYADISTGCQVFHFCENTQLQTMTCPVGEAFNTLSSKCQAASTVTCYQILKLGKKLPTVLIKKNYDHVRSKRQISHPKSDIGFALPFLKSLIKTRIENVFGPHNRLINTVILPTIFEMLDNPESRRELYSAYNYAKTVFTSVRRSRSASYRNREVSTVPRDYVNRAVFSFERKTKVIVTKLEENHLSNGIKRMYSNIMIVFESMYELKATGCPHAGVLIESVTTLVSKYRILLKTSIETHANICSVPEFMKDFRPVRTIFAKVMVEYLYRNTYSFLRILYGDSS